MAKDGRPQWGGSSPDLNSIEPLIWKIKKDALALIWEKYRSKGKGNVGRAEAIECLRLAWEQYDHREFVNYTKHLPSVMQTVVSLDGGNNYRSALHYWPKRGKMLAARGGSREGTPESDEGESS